MPANQEYNEQYIDLFARLAAPFEPEEVKVRSQAGRQLYYITARTAMNRLDNVLGPTNWWDAFEPHENSVLCRLTIRLPDGTTLTKSDAGGYAGMPDSGDDDKSGYSDSFKRACVKFGISRYLYRDGVPTFASEYAGEASFHIDTGAMPETPAHAGAASQQVPSRTSGGNFPQPADRSPYGNTPKTGRALFAWTKDMEKKYEVGLLKYLNEWSKMQEFPGRMIDWDTDQVALAHDEAIRKLSTLRHGGDRPERGEAYDGN